jgi:hypothetical protein
MEFFMTESVSAPLPSRDYEAGIGHPDFRRLILKMLRAIARSAKVSFAKLAAKTKRALGYLDAQWVEGARIDSRSRQILEDRYTQNWHSIRGIR